MTDAHTQSQTFHGRRAGYVLYALVSALFVVAGAVTVVTDPRSWVSWLGIVFFGVGVVVFVRQLVRPARLRLDAAGVSYRPPLQQEWFCRWDEVSEFGLVRSSQPFIIFDRPHAATASPRMSAVNRGLMGGNSAILVKDLARREPAQIALVQLLNTYRDRAMMAP